MKHLTILAMMLLLGTMAPLSAQTADNDEEGLFIEIEPSAEFEGGMQAIMSYIRSNVRYPKNAKNVEGKVFIRFTIEKDGSVSNAKVVRSDVKNKKYRKALEKEALRLIRNMPRWKPALHNGEPVRCDFTIPVTFNQDKD